MQVTKLLLHIVFRAFRAAAVEARMFDPGVNRGGIVGAFLRGMRCK